jgi:hypothetical protein
MNHFYQHLKKKSNLALVTTTKILSKSNKNSKKLRQICFKFFHIDENWLIITFYMIWDHCLDWCKNKW